MTGKRAATIYAILAAALYAINVPLIIMVVSTWSMTKDTMEI